MPLSLTPVTPGSLTVRDAGTPRLLLDGVPADVPATSLATSEDMFVAVPIAFGTLSATKTYPLFAAPFPLRVMSATLLLHDLAFAAHSTNYWHFMLRRWRGDLDAYDASTDPNGYVNVMVGKGTAVDGITQRLGWRLDQYVFDDEDRVLRKDDELGLVVTKNGFASDLTGNAVVTVRYERLAEQNDLG